MRFEGLDLNLLVALDAILEERSVMGASRRLHLSQPAMSAAIGRLRQYFNDEIFTISKRKLVPTPLAQSLEKPTRDILLRIRTNLISPPKFDPANSERRFRLVVSDYFLNEDDQGVVHLEGDHKVRVLKVTHNSLTEDTRFQLDFNTAFPTGPARPHGLAMK